MSDLPERLSAQGSGWHIPTDKEKETEASEVRVYCRVGLNTTTSWCLNPACAFNRLCNRVLAESNPNLLPPSAALPNLEHFVVPSYTASALFHVYTYKTLMRYKSAQSYCLSQGCGVTAGNIPVCAYWLHLAYFTTEQGEKGVKTH